MAGAFVIVSTLLGVMIMQRLDPPAEIVRFTIDVPEGTTLGHARGPRGSGPAAPHFALSPDGRRFAYIVSTGDTPRLWVRRIDAVEGELLPGTGVLHYYEAEPARQSDLWIVPVETGAAPRPFLQTPFNEDGGFISPDGRWVAYQSNEGGTGDVYVCALPACDRKQRISVGGGDYPQWRRDGRELFYVARTTLMAVEVSSGENLQPGVPKPLFATRMRANGIGQYAVAANGQRFLINEVDDTPSPLPITLVLNWPAALKR